MRKIVTTSIVLLLAAGSLAACQSATTMGESTSESAATSGTADSGSSASDASASTSGQNTGTRELAAIVKKPELLADSEVKVPMLRGLELSVDSDADKWQASVSDPSIAEFAAGSADMRPRFTPVTEGSTEATLTSPSGETVIFTLTVTPGSN